MKEFTLIDTIRYKISDWYRKTKWYIKWNFNKSKLNSVKEMIKSDNFDYDYLLKVEQVKLKEMLNYYKKVTWIDTNSIIRELKWCIKLIDIFTDECEPKYVNIRNWKRFSDIDMEYIYEKFPEELYKVKAFNLYHKIRMYKMQTWWD